ncbi:MAG: thiamine pyrophosphate-binding protein [Chromatiales bacterium]|nr:thiamine pyrophosphate-binding protein [Chromatiales bacterium]
MRLADLLLEHLRRLGVDYVFGVPGGAIEPLFDALARSERAGGLRVVVARHESGAASMADGYARETGKLGVCCATTGPGTTNLITGVASAYTDNTPMLVISAQTALPQFGRGALQESSCTAIDTVAMLQHCTVYNTLVSHRDQLEPKLISAVMAACRPPGGPAHLSIPRDVLGSAARDRVPKADLTALIRAPELVDQAALDELCGMVSKAGRVAILVGGDAGVAIDKIIAFADLIGADLIATPQGKTWVDAYHPRFHGVFGFAGHGSARALLVDQDLDWVLAVGTTLDEFATGGWDEEALLNPRLLHIEASPERFARSPMARLHVCGSLPRIFDTLVDRARQACKEGRLYKRQGEAVELPVDVGRCGPNRLELNGSGGNSSGAGPVPVPRLLCELTRRLSEDTRFVVDAGNSFVWTTHYLNTRRPGRYRVAMGFGAMAWAPAAAVGTALGYPQAPVVCVTGDGSYLMGGQELSVAVAEDLPVLFVVLNDRALGMVKHGQRLGGAEPVAYELPAVDFAAMARAVGARASVIHSRDDLARLDLESFGPGNGPMLLDVRVDPEAVPPMDLRVRTLSGA